MQELYTHSHSKWFAKDAAAVLERLEADENGLSQEEAAARLAEFGPNELPEKKGRNVILRFLRHFHDILIYILIFSAFVTLVLQHYVDTAVILAVAVINAVIGFFQEHKAEKALANIKNMLSLKADVLRDGKRQVVDAADLTIGDIVLLEPGDKVPADLRLLRADNLKIEESALTGEAVPSDKQTGTLEADTMLGDRSNMAFSGTTVSTGTGLGVVAAIGLDTEIGRISQLLAEVEPNTTPLLRQTAAFGKTVSVVIVALAALVYLFGHFYRSYPPSELLLSTIGLAIAAIPEGLPACLSIILALGVQNMARRKAIVRSLPSVETLGSVSVICSDKTGTLTKNEMTVKHLALRDEQYEVTGSGYDPAGEIRQGSQTVLAGNRPLLAELVCCFRLCNDSELGKDEQQRWIVKGDPTEGALLALYDKSGLGDMEAKKAQTGEVPLCASGSLASRLATLPFDSEYKYMATLVDGGPDYNLILIKGAPDRLLDMADRQKNGRGELEDLDRGHWESEVSRLARQGERVMGAAMKRVDKSFSSVGHQDIADGIIFLGLAGILDPPRDEAAAAIQSCHQAGIEVKMITGDHAETAGAIGRAMGICSHDGVLLGREIDEMTDEQLQTAARKHSIFARTSPEHKLRLVKAIQADGSICAMTGDGVNDAPALKMADVGVAMGIKGTEVTKDAAEMVLADDNFSTIVAAVEEGRRVYDNVKKTILFILPTNGAESFLIIASILFGTLIPLTPVQILWVNMVTSVTISLALAFEPVEDGAMLRRPRPPREKLLNGYFIWRILFVSVLIGGITLIMNIRLLEGGYPVSTVRTVTLQTIVMCQMFHLFNSRSIRASAFHSNPFRNRAIIVVCVLLLALQLAVTYLPFMNAIFGTVPLGLSYWLLPLGLGFVVFWVVEAEKFLMRRLDRRRGKNAEDEHLAEQFECRL